MKNLLTIVALVLLLSACSTTPYEPVYINDRGDYYIAETEQSNGYYVYESVILRQYGFSPWWYDSWYYSPYYAWYGYGWPYDYLGWYRPWYSHGYGHAYAHQPWGRGGYGWRPVYVGKPALSDIPDVNTDVNGNLPAPIRPVTMRQGFEHSLETAARGQEMMQRGRLAYRSEWREYPASKDMVLRQSAEGKYQLSQKPIKIDSRKLPRTRPAAWKVSDSGFRIPSRAVSPGAPSLRASTPVSRSSARISRTRIDRH